MAWADLKADVFRVEALYRAVALDPRVGGLGALTEQQQEAARRLVEQTLLDPRGGDLGPFAARMGGRTPLLDALTNNAEVLEALSHMMALAMVATLAWQSRRGDTDDVYATAAKQAREDLVTAARGLRAWGPFLAGVTAAPGRASPGTALASTMGLYDA